MISFGNPNLADVVEQGRELCVAPLAGGKSELVDDRKCQLDDVLAVLSRVRVVGLDDVAEQERCPAVGVAQLELVIDAHTPLAREDGEESDERQGEQHSCGGASARKGDGEPDRGEPGIDHVDRAHRAQVEPGRHSERGPLANRVLP